MTSTRETTTHNGIEYAPEGFKFYSVSTPTVFVEHMLPESEDDYTDDDTAAWDELAEVAGAHRTIVESATYRRG